MSAEQVISIAELESSKKIASLIRPQWEQIQVQATKVLNAALEGAQHNKRASVRDLFRDITINMPFEFKNEYISSRVRYRALMQEVYLLQIMVNAYMGQAVQMVFAYVSEDQQVILYTMDNTIEHLVNNKSGYNKYKMPREYDLLHAGARDGLFKERILPKPTPKLDAAYRTSYIRGRDTKNLKNFLIREQAQERYTLQDYQTEEEKNKLMKPKNFTNLYIYWRIQEDIIKGVWVNGFGVLAEAYAGFALHELDLQNEGEAGVEEFITRKDYGVLEADSAHGFFQGDVERFLNDSISIEYGIKANKASAMKFAKIIKWAQIIRNTPSGQANQILQGLKQQAASEGRKNLAKNLKESQKQDLQKIISMLEGKDIRTINIQI